MMNHRRLQYLKQRRVQYLKQWVAFFTESYSAHPTCQLCNRPLKYNNTPGNAEPVHFDHRQPSEIIAKPYGWYKCRPCNDKNKAIWKQHNFGLLCGRCNTFIPTKNRQIWKDKLCAYIDAHNKEAL